jgi:hypothetical protein
MAKLQFTIENTAAYWDRVQRQLDKQKRKWTQKRNKEAQKFLSVTNSK